MPNCSDVPPTLHDGIRNLNDRFLCLLLQCAGSDCSLQIVKNRSFFDRDKYQPPDTSNVADADVVVARADELVKQSSLRQESIDSKANALLALSGILAPIALYALAEVVREAIGLDGSAVNPLVIGLATATALFLFLTLYLLVEYLDIDWGMGLAIDAKWMGLCKQEKDLELIRDLHLVKEFNDGRISFRVYVYDAARKTFMMFLVSVLLTVAASLIGIQNIMN